jgi:hypothetical protein
MATFSKRNGQARGYVNVNAHCPIRVRSTVKTCLLLPLLLSCSLTAAKAGSEPIHAGFLYDEFKLTLEEGFRIEALGPLYYNEQKDTQRTWAIPPFFALSEDPKTDFTEYDVLYPLLSLDRFGQQYRWHLLQLLSWAGGPSQVETERRRFTLFPIYFQQRSSEPTENYTAVFPLYGHLKHRLFKDEISFVMFPFYAQTRKRDIVTDNYVYPLFHKRYGNGLTGWQFWPVAGHEHKDVTAITNRFGGVESVPGHDRAFAGAILYMNETNGIGTTNVSWEQASLPLYHFTRSENRDSTTLLWPLFSKIDDREKKYREWQVPWPLVVIARGEGKTTTRYFPFYSRARGKELTSDFYLWPIYKVQTIHAPPLDRKRTRILFFVYSDTIQKSTETGKSRRRTDLFPFFTRRKDYDGSERLQVLAPLEPFVPGSKSIERDWSQLWSIWRAEKNARTGASSRSLLWNLYRYDSEPNRKKCSLLFGLFQYDSGAESKRTRIFYIPVGQRGTPSRERKTAAQ